MVAPLTNLTKMRSGPFVWSPEAERAFQALKVRFTSAPILTLPDPCLPFVVEVDASDVAVCAVLSQSLADGKLHPCAFLSSRLSPAERNYDVGDRELLAIKMALEEWRHWLEGAQHPFLVWTDHKNLEYVQKARRLNPRQARWALFFSRFDFVLSYRPGSKNQKPDALFRLFQNTDHENTPATILPDSIPVRWGIETLVRQAQRMEPDPGNGPSGRLFVPTSVRTQVLQWGHSSQLTNHPVTGRTLAFLKRQFWWPRMNTDVKSFVAACPA